MFDGEAAFYAEMREIIFLRRESRIILHLKLRVFVSAFNRVGDARLDVFNDYRSFPFNCGANSSCEMGRYVTS